jgi:alpha-mannosidase
LRYDVANGVVRSEKDQLAGACKNFFSVQSWVDISNSDYGVTWSTTNAPLVEIGGITAEQPWMKSIQPSSLIYSYVMNNYWHTNYKADQEGPVTFNYSLLPHAAFTAIDAVKFGVERRQPLIVALADPSTSTRRPLMRLSPEVLVSSVKPMAAGPTWLVYLYNPTAKTQKNPLQWNASVRVSIRFSDATGRMADPTHDLEVAAFGSAYFSISKSNW